MKTRNIIKTFLVTTASLVLSGVFAVAAHPLIFNGVIKSITDTTVQLGETTFTMLPACKISFEEAPGTVAEVTAAMAANPRLVGVIRREAPDSTNIVMLVVKANKPAVPAATPAAPATDSAPAVQTPAEAAPAE
jgi:hypothetical protein